MSHDVIGARNLKHSIHFQPLGIRVPIEEGKPLIEGAEVTLETIGRNRALGLCGSGVVEATWELVREGIVNSNGIMNSRSPWLRRNEETGIAEFVLAERHEAGQDRCIVLTHADISEIQLAKAAGASGMEILLSRAGITERDIRRVIVAGAFGNRLNLRSAVGIGMLPPVPDDRFEAVGNAPGTGARLVLMSEGERETAERIAQEVEYVEFTAEPDFATCLPTRSVSPHSKQLMPEVNSFRAQAGRALNEDLTALRHSK